MMKKIGHKIFHLGNGKNQKIDELIKILNNSRTLR